MKALVGEVTLACALLIGAVLMLRSFVNLLRLDAGFNPDNVLTANISLPEATYKDSAAVTGFSNSLLDSLRTMPGVEQVGLGSDLPWRCLGRLFRSAWHPGDTRPRIRPTRHGIVSENA